MACHSLKRLCYSEVLILSNAKELLIEVRHGRLRTALVIDGRLVELNVEDEEHPSLIGNIYIGRVEKIVDTLNACFVDLGLQHKGFLALAEILPIGAKAISGDKVSKHLCEGDKVCVQVLRDAYEDKGPKLTTHLRLASRSIVLTPGVSSIKISHRISVSKKRSYLRGLPRELTSKKEGFIVRTAAQSNSEKEIIAQVESLKREYQIIKDRICKSTTPTFIYGPPNGLIRTLRDRTPGDVSRIVIDDIQAYLEAKVYLEKEAPALMKRLIYHKGPQPLFFREELADDIDQALAASIVLPSGGSVKITETPALVAIDVNVAGTSKVRYEQSVLETNLEACAEITRQIRLRNLSGLLVVDFVSMKNNISKNKVLTTLKKLVRGDPEQIFVAGFTRFGLVEMTRKRSKPSLRASLGQSCLVCEGSGVALTARTHGFNVLDCLRLEGLSYQNQGLELRVSKTVASCLTGQLKVALDHLKAEQGVEIKISVDATLKDEFFDIIPFPLTKGGLNG